MNAAAHPSKLRPAGRDVSCPEALRRALQATPDRRRTVQDLARETGFTKGYVASALAGLVAEGFAERVKETRGAWPQAWTYRRRG